MGWAFQGNPQKFDIDDYLSRYPQLIYWRTPRHAKNISVLDRAFIWRAGSESGAVAIGTIVETPTLAANVQHPEALGSDLWITSTTDPAEPKTGIHLQEIRLTAADNMVTRAIAKADTDLASISLIRMPMGTVFKLSETETHALERLWGVGAPSVGSDAESYAEGAWRLHSHYIRERSPRLRLDKLKDFRHVYGSLFCELCSESESARYPRDTSERIFEIHHRAPLSKAVMPVCTHLDDLAVLCANCHRAVHASADVEANFMAIKKHFTKQTPIAPC